MCQLAVGDEDPPGVIFRRRKEDAIGPSVTEAAPAHRAAGSIDSLLASIDRLQSESRGGRDAETLRRLLRLRHQAGLALVGSDLPTAAYPSPASSLPVVTEGELPDLRPEDLTPELVRAAFLRDGCAVVRGLIDRERASGLGEELRQLFERRDRGETAADGQDLDYEEFVPDPPGTLIERPWVNAAGGIWLADSPKLMSDVLDLYDEVGLRRVITGYIGERPTLSVNKSTLRRASASVSSVDWHQDGAFMGDVRTLNVWLSLSDCGDAAPGLAVVPRRIDQIVTTGTSGAAFDWSVSPMLAEEVAAPAGTLRPTFEPGDAVLFDNFFLHATWVHKNMPDMRYAIESWFFSPSSFPNEYVPLVF